MATLAALAVTWGHIPQRHHPQPLRHCRSLSLQGVAELHTLGPDGGLRFPAPSIMVSRVVGTARPRKVSLPLSGGSRGFGVGTAYVIRRECLLALLCPIFVFQLAPAGGGQK